MLFYIQWVYKRLRMSIEKTFAELLVYYRSKADLSQEDLANKSGVSKIQIARYETGKGSAPRLRTVMKLADALDISIDDLGYRSSPRVQTISAPVEKGQSWMLVVDDLMNMLIKENKLTENDRYGFQIDTGDNDKKVTVTLLMKK